MPEQIIATIQLSVPDTEMNVPLYAKGWIGRKMVIFFLQNFHFMV